jgi:hypothetical protein
VPWQLLTAGQVVEMMTFLVRNMVLEELLLAALGNHLSRVRSQMVQEAAHLTQLMDQPLPQVGEGQERLERQTLGPWEQLDFLVVVEVLSLVLGVHMVEAEVGKQTITSA